jgi:hypothetical protein
MFNYPIKIKKVKGAYKCYSPKKLSSKKYRYGFIELGECEVKDGTYCYDIVFEEGFSSKVEQSMMWAELTVSLEEFEKTLDWIKFPKNCLILPILNKVKKVDVSPTQMEIIVDFILNRPEKSYIDYVELVLIHEGIQGIYSKVTQLENMHLDSVYFMDRFTNRPIINEYNFSDIDKYAYHCDSLIDKFLIKTDNFNQCFKYGDEHYSSVSVIKREEEYSVYVYGCDDSSYTKYFNTLEQAKFDCEILKRLSRVINRSHIKALKYEFTN